MGNGECQTKASIFIDGAAAVFAAHSTDWSKACQEIIGNRKHSGGKEWDYKKYCILLHNFMEIKATF